MAPPLQRKGKHHQQAAAQAVGLPFPGKPGFSLFERPARPGAAQDEKSGDAQNQVVTRQSHQPPGGKPPARQHLGEGQDAVARQGPVPRGDNAEDIVLHPAGEKAVTADFVPQFCGQVFVVALHRPPNFHRQKHPGKTARSARVRWFTPDLSPPGSGRAAAQCPQAPPGCRAPADPRASSCTCPAPAPAPRPHPAG